MNLSNNQINSIKDIIDISTVDKGNFIVDLIESINKGQTTLTKDEYYILLDEIANYPFIHKGLINKEILDKKELELFNLLINSTNIIEYIYEINKDKKPCLYASFAYTPSIEPDPISPLHKAIYFTACDILSLTPTFIDYTTYELSEDIDSLLSVMTKLESKIYVAPDMKLYDATNVSILNDLCIVPFKPSIKLTKDLTKLSNLLDNI